MAQNISVPDIGDFDSVEVIEVLIKVGDQINKEDPIVTLESDKSSVEVPSPFDGKILELNVKVGDKVSKGSLLAKLENDSAGVEKIEDKSKDVPLEKKKTVEKKEIESNNPNKIIKKIFAKPSSKDDLDPLETQEWIESIMR
jgi:Pyruvate/2-oxoglutarate dehydrogenase complex, dihydrolipoamide acyltransferase (E2) component, and related enzymes